MNCTHVIALLDAAFDEAKALDASVAEHLAHCEACAAYQDSLVGLDSLLRHGDPVEEDPALVARIQEALSQQPTYVLGLPWHGVAAALVLILASLTGGWLLDDYIQLPALSFRAVQPEDIAVPDWNDMRNTLVAIPMEVRHEATLTATHFSGLWDLLTGWSASLFHASGLFLWGGCFVGLMVVVVLDSRLARRLT
tara:strand:- start:382 stop:966 length:585 start_codon:yes stop_codon:yes gene_type:complete